MSVIDRIDRVLNEQHLQTVMLIWKGYEWRYYQVESPDDIIQVDDKGKSYKFKLSGKCNNYKVYTQI
jgi:hypothetical protein